MGGFANRKVASIGHKFFMNQRHMDLWVAQVIFFRRLTDLRFW